MQAQSAKYGGVEKRLVCLGASNLTLGFQQVVGLARALWGDDIPVFAALGYGRSYGMQSRVAGRTLPGILSSGLWRDLKKPPYQPTQAVITDIGNDILYGVPPARILDWMAECIERFQEMGASIIMTDLPLANMEGLSQRRFLFYRSILIPSCRLSFQDICKRALAVSAGLRNLALKKEVVLIRPQPAWYGFDPFHIRPSQWNPAWYKILTGGEGGRGMKTKISLRTPLDFLRIHVAKPETQWWFGIKIDQSQPCLRIGASDIGLY